MVRASCITIKDVGVLHASLVRLAFEGLPLDRCITRHPTPDGWDSEAFCTVMNEAANGIGLPGDGGTKNAVRAIICDYRGGRLKGSMQSKVYKAISQRLPSDWMSLLSRRAEKLCPELPPLSVSTFEELQTKLCKYGHKHGTHNAMYVIKTFTNGWLTTCRMHENPVLPCIFGCNDCKDDLTHYLCCPTLWTLVGDIGPLPFDPAMMSVSHRLCLTNPSFDSFRVCGAACWLYHGLKIGERSRIDELVNLDKFADVCTLANEIIKECPLKTS